MFSLATARIFILTFVAAFALIGVLYPLASKCKTPQKEGRPGSLWAELEFEEPFPLTGIDHDTVLFSRKILISTKNRPKSTIVVSNTDRRGSLIHRLPARQLKRWKSSGIRLSDRRITKTLYRVLRAPPVQSHKSHEGSVWFNEETKIMKDTPKSFSQHKDFHVDYSGPRTHPPHNH
ncbi:hypothetical protein O6H91_21G067700 [Diphasiastrum complanatum]|uniref:Uncharacterized protein n=1 Tax=Diphasiastrum complanatum TaxID=34168 RepID=A0ACC2ALI7_DIPCM|nr:hypothetical protein O6H91_21G067700 [Diphasiastrum complanatum]